MIDMHRESIHSASLVAGANRKIELTSIGRNFLRAYEISVPVEIHPDIFFSVNRFESKFHNNPWFFLHKEWHIENAGRSAGEGEFISHFPSFTKQRTLFAQYFSFDTSLKIENIFSDKKL